MSAARHDIKVEQGATLDLSFTWRAAATPEALALDPEAVGDPINLTGYSARMHLRHKLTSAEPVHEFTTENGGIVLGGAAGTVQILASAEDTASWSWGPTSAPQMTGLYDLELVDGAGRSRRLLEGRFTVKREVTRG